jgi:hypothetical protein
MKPGGRAAVQPGMNESEIDDRGLAPQDPADPASPQHPDPTLCPECEGLGSLSSGEVCPVCEGSGKASGRTGGG